MANTVTVFPPVLWAQRKEKVLLTVQVEDVVNPNVEIDENQITFRTRGLFWKIYHWNNWPIPVVNFQTYSSLGLQMHIPQDHSRDYDLRKLRILVEDKIVGKSEEGLIAAVECFYYYSHRIQAVGGVDKREFAVTIQFYKQINPEECKKLITSRHVYFEIKKKDKGDSFWPRLTKDAMKFHWLKTDFNLWQDEDDSDTENAEPDMNLEEMMQSMGGLGGAGDLGAGEGDDEEEDSDDENMPDLE